MPKIDRLFDKMLARKGSDLHLAQGQKPKIREHGEMVALDDEPILEGRTIQEYLQEICEPKRWETFLRTKDIDFAYEKDAKSRFRCNYYMQVHGMGAVFRIIPTKILTLEDLRLPRVLRSFAHYRSGLVLVTGPTGSGKSTTLAAIINHINENHPRYILTIEEPIEFVHPNKKSYFCQREVGVDVASFADGLKTATRQDCDVILVGEMRDYETISLALSAAAKGILVFGTLHTNSAIKTIDRIIDVFPPEIQGQARTMLADCLRGVCAQLLMKKTSGGRVGVNEILLEASGLAACIREGNNAFIHNIMQSGQSKGMCMMDDSIFNRLKDGEVEMEEAYLLSENKDLFRDRVKNLPGAGDLSKFIKGPEAGATAGAGGASGPSAEGTGHVATGTRTGIPRPPKQ